MIYNPKNELYCPHCKSGQDEEARDYILAAPRDIEPQRHECIYCDATFWVKALSENKIEVTTKKNN